LRRDGVHHGRVGPEHPGPTAQPERRITLNVAARPPDSLKARAHWPDSPEHRQIRRWCVRLMRSGVASGSGILVGPDLVLTCAHVVDDLLRDDAGPAVLDLVEVQVGLGHPGDGPPIRRGLRRYHDGTGPLYRPPWRIPLGAAAHDLDFALLRLDGVIERDPEDPEPGDAPTRTGIDWLDFRSPQSPARLATKANGAPVGLFMYHFPDPGTGSPFIEPDLSSGEMPGTWTGDAPLVPHQMPSAEGSSGAMIFATVQGTVQPFPIAVHRGAYRGSPDKGATAIAKMLPVIETNDPVLHRQMSMRPADFRVDRFLNSLAQPRVELARSLLDREEQANIVVGGMIERAKRVQPVFEVAHDEMTAFQERLIRFDLPLQRLTGPQVMDMRQWALGGLSAIPPVRAEVTAWALWPLNSEGWLPNGAADAVTTILTNVESARERGTKLLLTARVEVRGLADYKALEDLMLTFAKALTGPAADGDFLLLLWVCDTGHMSEKRRSGARNALQTAWRELGRTSVVGGPLELGSLDKDDLRVWAHDIETAFDVPKPALQYTIDTAWSTLDQTPRAPRRHAFDPVLRALDPPLRDWVFQHFRRYHESRQPKGSQDG